MCVRLALVLLLLPGLARAATPAWSPQALLAAQEESGSWPAMPIGGTRIDATAYALLSLSGSTPDSTALQAADRAAEWLSRQPVEARTLDLHSRALAILAVTDWSLARGKHDWDAWLDSQVDLLDQHQIRHPHLQLRLGWPRRPGGQASDTATTLAVLLALTALGQQRGSDLSHHFGGAATWYVLAWAAANRSIEAEAPSRFPSRFLVEAGGGSIPVDTDTGRSDAGLLAAILLAHTREDRSRQTLKQHLSGELLPSLMAGQADLRRWWTADLAWRLQFGSRAAAEALGSHHQHLLTLRERHGELPLLHWCLRVSAVDVPLPHFLQAGGQAVSAPAAVAEEDGGQQRGGRRVIHRAVEIEIPVRRQARP